LLLFRFLFPLLLGYLCLAIPAGQARSFTVWRASWAALLLLRQGLLQRGTPPQACEQRPHCCCGACYCFSTAGWKHTGRPTDGQTDRPTPRQADRRTSTGRRTNRQARENRKQTDKPEKETSTQTNTHRARLQHRCPQPRRTSSQAGAGLSMVLLFLSCSLFSTLLVQSKRRVWGSNPEQRAEQ